MTDSPTGPTELDDGSEATAPRSEEWKVWPPSPKMQIILIAVGFGLFNFLLLAIWAVVMIWQF
jgi:hypothetical protein